MTTEERILRLEACVSNLTEVSIKYQERMDKMQNAIKNLEYRTRKLGAKKGKNGNRPVK